VGENVTYTVQLPFAVSVVPQVLLEMANSLAFVPPMLKALNVSVVLPLFVSETGWLLDPLVVPTL
jgi:hypothetical protein